MGADGGYRLYRVSDVEPHLPKIWRVLRKNARKQIAESHFSAKYMAWILDIKPSAATISNLVGAAGGRPWANLLSDPTIFVVPLLRLSYGSNVIDMLDDVSDALGHVGIRRVASEGTWT